jgi:hypothetical protein
MLAHGALVVHVTCGGDGELTHLRPGSVASVPARDVAGAAVDSGNEGHDHCLLDEDGDAECPTSHVASGEPFAPSRFDRRIQPRARVSARPAPLYRLAPKNSPPA